MEKYQVFKELEVVLEAFKEWGKERGIGEDPEDWLPWWECFLAGYEFRVQQILKQQSEPCDFCDLNKKFYGHAYCPKCGRDLQ